MEKFSIFFQYFDHLDKIAYLSQSVSLFFATLLIPLAIAIFRNRDYEELDKYTILDYVLQAKWTLYSLLCLLSIPVIWKVSSFGTFNLIALIIFILCVLFIILIPLKRSYQWLRRDKYLQRFQYLEKNNNLEILLESWNSVWKFEKESISNEVKFLEIFAKKIDEFIAKNKPRIVGSLFSDFYSYFDNRSLQGLNKIFPYILKWHYKISKRVRENKDEDVWWGSGVYPPLISIDEIARQIVKRTLKSKDRWMVEGLFKKLKAHIEDYGEKKVNGIYYSEIFFDSFSKIIFEEIPKSPLEYEICNRYFPSQWKITKEKLEKGDKISIVIFNNFKEWMLQRILDNQDMSFDKVLDYDLRCLFPSVSSIYWSRILLFIFSDWVENSEYKNKVEYIIRNRKINFGLGEIGPVMTFSNTKEGEAIKKAEAAWKAIMDSKIKSTFELVDFLSNYEHNFYSFKKNLKRYIITLQNLEGKFEANSTEEYRRKEYLEIFSNFDNFLKTQK